MIVVVTIVAWEPNPEVERRRGGYAYSIAVRSSRDACEDEF
jgi:hypothetical protein